MRIGRIGRAHMQVWRSGVKRREHKGSLRAHGGHMGTEKNRDTLDWLVNNVCGNNLRY